MCVLPLFPGCLGARVSERALLAGVRRRSTLRSSLSPLLGDFSCARRSLHLPPASRPQHTHTHTHTHTPTHPPRVALTKSSANGADRALVWGCSLGAMQSGTRDYSMNAIRRGGQPCLLGTRGGVELANVNTRPLEKFQWAGLQTTPLAFSVTTLFS